MNCRTSRFRAAPSARRTATSRSRDAARAQQQIGQIQTSDQENDGGDADQREQWIAVTADEEFSPA
jgi:hypothetical protein